MDVARVTGEEAAKDEEDFARRVGWGVEEGGAGHVQGVLEAGLAFRVFLTEFL